MKPRIISFINDTADQQDKLHMLCKDGEINDKEAKSQLSKWGFLHLRLQAMIYGRTVLADSHLFNNFFLHELDDNEYRSFVECVSVNGFIEARCRKNSVLGLMVREYNIRDYWSKEFQKRICKAGGMLKENIDSISKAYGKEISSVREYIEALCDDRFVGEDFFSGSSTDTDVSDEFKKYCKIMPRADWLVEGLRKYELIFPWENTAPKDPNVTSLFNKEKGNLLKEINEFRETFRANSDAIEKLIKEVKSNTEYNGSKIERLCNDMGVPKAREFFLRIFHKDIFCQGLAKQHKCGYMQTVSSDTDEDIRGLALRMSSKECNELCGMSWDVFSKCYSNPLFQEKQRQLFDKLQDKNSRSNDRQIAFKEILWDSFGLDASDENDYSQSQSEVVHAANVINPKTLSESLYIVSSNDENDGISILFGKND